GNEETERYDAYEVGEPPFSQRSGFALERSARLFPPPIPSVLLSAHPCRPRLAAWLRELGQRASTDCSGSPNRPALGGQAVQSLAPRRPRRLALDSHRGSRTPGSRIRRADVHLQL